jgi:hypothetical protein
MKNVSSVVLSVVFLVAAPSFAKDAPKANSFRETLTPVTAAELPAKAADLVLNARSRDRGATTVDVIKAAVGINPAAAPAIVGAIARSVPDMASIAAGAAAAEQPKQAAAIARAAAAAAPSRARKIVLAVCRAVPGDYRNIAIAVSDVVPGSNKEVLNAVASALPGLKPYIEQALAAYGGNVLSVADTLDQAARLAQARTAPGTASPTLARTAASGAPSASPAPAPLARGPAVGPPYIPLTSTPIYVTPGTSGEVPIGGRDYARP